MGAVNQFPLGTAYDEVFRKGAGGNLFYREKILPDESLRGESISIAGRAFSGVPLRGDGINASRTGSLLWPRAFRISFVL